MSTGARVVVARRVGATRTSAVRRAAVVVRATASAEETDALGFKMMRKGVKVAADETVLTPR
jgi:magnesium-protoporphyrin IX monomethyl ester (oxidative) cyclase